MRFVRRWRPLFPGTARRGSSVRLRQLPSRRGPTRCPDAVPPPVTAAHPWHLAARAVGGSGTGALACECRGGAQADMASDDSVGPGLFLRPKRPQNDWTADGQRRREGEERMLKQTAVAASQRRPKRRTKEKRKMVAPIDPMLWHKVAAVSGVAALGLGTYGAHMFRPKNPAYKEVWHTASLYHLVHTAALLGAPITKRPNVFGGLLTVGIVLFSGTCYTVAYLEDRKFSSPAPLGGFAFIAAWASLLF